MEKKPMQPAIYQDVINEYQAKEGQSYNEIKAEITNEYERRCAAYLPNEGIWEGDSTAQQQKTKEKFIKKYKDRGKLNPYK